MNKRIRNCITLILGLGEEDEEGLYALVSSYCSYQDNYLGFH